MPIGLTARQKADLSAMLPNVEDSINSLKRLIADTKDRTKALARLAEAEEAQKRHARDVGIPFNADAFARRRAELESLPSSLTVEEGQLAAFTSLQKAASILVEGPYVREGRGGGASKSPNRGASKSGAGKRANSATKSTRSTSRSASRSASKAPAKKSAKSPAKAASKSAAKVLAKAPAKTSTNAPAPMKRVKPLPLALGS